VPLIENYISKAARQYEEKLGITFQIGISTQMPSTDTVAADEDNGLFRDESGLPVFRPGGHGALIENLNALKADIVLIKNIDNIVPDRLKTVTVRYKKILGGFLLKLQASIFDYLRRLEEESLNSDLISEIVRFCENDLKIVFPSSFRPLDLKGQQDFLKERLHRPLRVCGVVKNEGEPGGGPFWVEEEDGTQSLQIIESAQVDFRFEDQKTIWKSAGYFNPVDLACGLRDYQGNSFDLSRFIDRRAYLIAEKSQGGRALKALEHPGLWNGAMAHWNTIFLEVPIETFNPVKTVEDLLRKQHQ